MRQDLESKERPAAKMTTFTHLLEELVQQTVTLTPAEVKRMVERYGDRTLQMGNLADDGSLQIPVDCILEAVHVLGNQKVGEALHGFQSERVATALESVETLMDNVISARRRKVLKLATAVQEAESREEALEPWKRLEDTLFGP